MKEPKPAGPEVPTRDRVSVVLRGRPAPDTWDGSSIPPSGGVLVEDYWRRPDPDTAFLKKTRSEQT